MVQMVFDDLIKARFVERPNRFILHCRLPDGEVVRVHLPDPGRLKELLVPDAAVMLQYTDDPNRKTKWSAAMVARGDGGWVSVNTQIPNVLAREAIEKELIEEFSGWRFVRAEYKKGGSRWDLLLEEKAGHRKMAVEVKGVSLVDHRGRGAFPDAVTARGTKHVRELAEIAGEEGWEAALFFVAQREDTVSVEPARWIDPDFAEAIGEAARAGVRILGRKCEVTPERIRMNTEEPLHILV
ncbi:DNA/RNA nuclease SfsA [Alteribacter lacisalsi]|uniref:Sugar fermentation stimulation protein homolog n=1 Tax=Alteribacter lacisalsi TaxID=2045244 RepID=A0A2W0HDV2_9BACI|nr:DNA/RNA nuclease SfsA [Alteribacter lacisalsi]PYZ99041.1 DNA/RNA nuclease SfsA [Alteribacter lacisalsi]